MALRNDLGRDFETAVKTTVNDTLTSREAGWPGMVHEVVANRLALREHEATFSAVIRSAVTQAVAEMLNPEGK